MIKGFEEYSGKRKTYLWGSRDKYGVAGSGTWLSVFTFTFPFHTLEKEMATHSSVLAWRISGTREPGGLSSMGSHRVGHDWSDLAAAAAETNKKCRPTTITVHWFWNDHRHQVRIQPWEPKESAHCKMGAKMMGTSPARHLFFCCFSSSESTR